MNNDNQNTGGGRHGCNMHGGGTPTANCAKHRLGTCFCSCGGGHCGVDAERNRRMSACWNACDGMAVEAIEALQGIGTIGDLKASERATPAAASTGAAGTIDGRTFHELAMDYRGASITLAALKYRDLIAHIDQHTAAAYAKGRRDAVRDYISSGLVQATEGGDLTDTQIVAVLASLGIDSEKSKHGFDVLQVRTTVPGIRDIVKAYRAATAPVIAEKIHCGSCLGTGNDGHGAGCTDCNGKGYDWDDAAPVSAAPTVSEPPIHDFRDDEEFGAILDDLHAAMMGNGSKTDAALVVGAMRKLNNYIRDRMRVYAAKVVAALPQSAGGPAEPDCRGCDPAEGFCKICRSREVSAGAPVSAAEPKTVEFDGISGQAMPALSLSDIRGAVARGWCAPVNSSKEMDVDLAEACAQEVVALLAMRQPQGESIDGHLTGAPSLVKKDAARLPTTYRLVVEWESARMEPDPAGEWVKRADWAVAQAQGDLYTCIGKGGEYEFIGYSNGAGARRGETIVVYSSTNDPDTLFHRGSVEFDRRMTRIAANQAGKK